MTMYKKLSKKMGKVFSFFSSKDRKRGPRPVQRRKMVIVGDGECGKTCLVSRMSSGEFQDNGYLPTVFETQVIPVHTGREEVDLTVYDTAGQEDYDRLRPFSYHEVDVALICFSLADTDTLTNVVDKWAPEVKYFCGNIPIILVGNKKDLRDSPLDTDILLNGTKTNKTEKQKAEPEKIDADIETIRSVLSGNCVSPPDGSADTEENRLSWLRNPSSSTPRSFFHVQAPVKHSEGVHVANSMGAIAYFETSALTGDNVEELLLATTKASILGSKKSKVFKPFVGTLKSWQSIGALQHAGTGKLP